MFEFLNENPLIVLAFGVVITFILMFIFIKPSKKSKKKSESKKDKSKEKDKDDESEIETKDKQPEVEAQTEPQETNENNKVSKKRKKVHKSKSKPEITQIYKKVEESEKSSKEESSDNGPSDDLEKRAQFVKTSSKISKFIGLSDVVASEEAEVIESGLTEMPVQDVQENCEACEKKVKHFDHSRRLSKMVQENSFDDMIDAHISDHYLKMDANRHLGLSENYSEKLFDRAMKTLANSDVKVLSDEDKTDEKPVDKLKNDREYMKMWLENRKREELNKLMSETMESNVFDINDEFEKELKDDIDLSPKNIVVVDSILHRKGRNKKS